MYGKRLLVHEYGHTIQALIFGPLYLIVMGYHQHYGDSYLIFKTKEIMEFLTLVFLQRTLLIIWVRKLQKKNQWKMLLYKFMKDIPTFYGRGAWNEENMTFKDRTLCKTLQKAIAKKDPSTYEPWMKALIIHELLHAIVYPKNANVYIGIAKPITFVALASYPLKKGKFILMCLLPYILGIIPLVLFWIMPITDMKIHSILFGLSTMGLVSPYPDLFNVYQVLKQTPQNCKIQFYKDDTYYIE